MMEQRSFGLLCKNNPRTFGVKNHSLVGRSHSGVVIENQGGCSN